MARKQEIKKSEARVLIFISQASIVNCYSTNISLKLNMEYNFVSRCLRTMTHNGWIKKHHTFSSNKIYYSITQLGQQMLTKASEVLLKQEMRDNDIHRQSI